MNTFIVTTTRDESFTGTETPGAPDGTGLSLAEAIGLANASPGADEIVFAPGVDRLVLTQALPTITDALTITGDRDGDGAPDVTIDGDGRVRILDIDDAGDVRVEGLVLTGGRVVGDDGGAIRVTGESRLSLADSFLIDNGARFGGAIYSTSQLVVSGSTFEGNISSNPLGAGSGGASSGGAIQQVFAPLTITDSVFGGNVSIAGRGGAVTIVDDALTISGSRFESNAGARGGAIYANTSTIDIDDTFLRLNRALVDGGAILAVASEFTIDNSTFANNRAGPTGSGGAIFAPESGGAIENSTFYANSAGSGAAISFGNVAGNVVSNTESSIVHSTIVANSVLTRGGAIGAGNGTSVVIGNSIVTENFNGVIDSSISGPGVQLIGVNVVGQGLFQGAQQIATATGASGFALNLLPLANNGGPVPTLALRDNPNNLALDAADESLSPATDARGALRASGGASDLGAFELQTGPGAVRDLAMLDGSNGFRLLAAGGGTNDGLGVVVAGAGDFDGDGRLDLIVGAPSADPQSRENAGETIIVFGADDFPDQRPLRSGDIFRLEGISPGNRTGASVASAGDVNGDGIDDVIFGAPGANPGGGPVDAGEAYVLFGSAGPLPPSRGLANLTGDGVRLDGVAAGDNAGTSVAGGGDFNGDGFADVVVAAPFADPGGLTSAGSTYLVFGGGAFPGVLSLGALDGATGFRVDGAGQGHQSGTSVALDGDLNGDGLADLVIGAPFAGPGRAGVTYVVFGSREGVDPTLGVADLDGANGVALVGRASDFSGFSVAYAGDVNGDGIGDLVIGASGANGELGGAYVVFGRTDGFGPSVTLADLDGSDGFFIAGAGGSAGISVAGAGDVNGDGLADIVIGAAFADPDGVQNVGESYVVFGSAAGFPATVSLAGLDGGDGFRIPGLALADTFGQSVAGAGDLNRDGFDDLVIAAPNRSSGGPIQNGEVFVLFGAASPQLALTFSDAAVEEDGGPVTATLTRTVATDAALTVSLATSDPDALTAPATVRFAPGQTEAIITFAPVDDGIAGGDREVTIRATAPGFAAVAAELTVTAANEDPIARNDAVATDEDSAVSGALLANDVDPDAGDMLRVTAVNGGPIAGTITLASGALLSVSPDGTFDYDPNGAFETLPAGGETVDAFFYTITDGNGGFDTAGVSIAIAGVNDAPVAVDDTFSTDEDTAFITGNVLANDFDVDLGDTFVFVGVDTTGTLGRVADNGDGTFLYDPDGAFEDLAAGETATDRFVYTIRDASGAESTAEVIVAIEGRDEAAGLIEVAGTSGRNVLVGTAADELFLPGGGGDIVTTGGGADVILFQSLAGRRDLLTITDFDPLFDTLDLGGAGIAMVSSTATRTILLLEGPERDTIILNGVSFDDLVLV